MINQDNWYKSFFTGMALEMWDHALPQAFTDIELDFIKDVAPPPGSSVLDIPCGSGRLAIPLAKSGYRVTGMDISEGNLATLNRQKGALQLETICGDVLATNLTGSYDLGICMGNSFSYFPYGKMVEFAARVRGVLKPGAKFVINSGAVAEGLLINLKDTMEMQVGDILFKVGNQYDARNSVLKTEMQFIKGDLVETRTSFHFVFTLAEIFRMLRAAGFTDFEVYSDASKAEYKLGSHQAYLVAS